MPTEKRLITFDEHEVRKAIQLLPATARNAVWDENNQVSFGKGTTVQVKLADGTDCEVPPDKIGSALLLYCRAEHIPIPKKGMKTLCRDALGITLVIDIANALLANTWDTYDAPQQDGRKQSKGASARCPRCGR